MRKLVLIALILALVPLPELSAQKKKKKKKGDETAQVAPKKKKGALKDYAEVITSEAITDEGLITSHRVSDDYYFEIPAGLLEKEILVVSRIAGHVKGINFGGAGMKSRPQQVIRFQKNGKKILMRSVSFNNIADENEPIYTSVKNNNFEPVIETFALETMKGDSSSYVIKVTDFFASDIEICNGFLGHGSFKGVGFAFGRSILQKLPPR